MASGGALPRRQMLESEAHLREGEAQLVKASSRREVLDAEAQLKRAQAAVEAAQSHLRLSDTVYQTRLSQLGTGANENKPYGMFRDRIRCFLVRTPQQTVR